MKFMDGFKTILGALTLTVAVVAPKVAPQINEAIPHVVNIVQGGAAVLTILGVIHKREKAKASQ